jgi:hypothetical protein
LVRVQQQEEERQGVTGIALSAAAGLGLGVIGGMILRELLGSVSTEPVRQAVRRLSRPGIDRTGIDPQEVERSIYEAIAGDPDTQALEVEATALGDGLVELTGTVPSELDRQLAGDVARSVVGAEVVVNRILVEGSDRVASDPESESS